MLWQSQHCCAGTDARSCEISLQAVSPIITVAVTCRAEACGALMLGSPCEDSATSGALLLLGSAVNQDGRSSSLTAPNGPAQQDVILKALSAAEATPADLNVLQVCL